jgi:hypothetical protein
MISPNNSILISVCSLACAARFRANAWSKSVGMICRPHAHPPASAQRLPRLRSSPANQVNNALCRRPDATTRGNLSFCDSARPASCISPGLSLGLKLRGRCLKPASPAFSQPHTTGAIDSCASQDADCQAASCQAVSLSSWLQLGHRKMRISVSPPGTGTMATRFISAVQRQSGSSVEPATSSRSNFDMMSPIPCREIVR